jgi:hypothetical protein
MYLSFALFFDYRLHPYYQIVKLIFYIFYSAFIIMYLLHHKWKYITMSKQLAKDAMTAYQKAGCSRLKDVKHRILKHLR